MNRVVEERERPDVQPTEDNLARAHRAAARLREIGFELLAQSGKPHEPVEWHPDPLVRARRAAARLRALSR
jgi:hypothetical protein